MTKNYYQSAATSFNCMQSGMSPWYRVSNNGMTAKPRKAYDGYMPKVFYRVKKP